VIADRPIPTQKSETTMSKIIRYELDPRLARPTVRGAGLSPEERRGLEEELGWLYDRLILAGGKTVRFRTALRGYGSGRFLVRVVERKGQRCPMIVLLYRPDDAVAREAAKLPRMPAWVEGLLARLRELLVHALLRDENDEAAGAFVEVIEELAARITRVPDEVPLLLIAGHVAQAFGGTRDPEANKRYRGVIAHLRRARPVGKPI
jgi:hypothetical protein